MMSTTATTAVGELSQTSGLKRNHPSNERDCQNKITPLQTSSISRNKFDTYSRNKTSSSKGRGSLSGWALCPICFLGNKNDSLTKTKSTKKYALGRGIAAHLKAAHTPWKPGKLELSRRYSIRRRLKGLACYSFNQKKNLCDRKRLENPKLAHLPIPADEESEVEYYNRLAKKELGDVWDRDGVKRATEWTPTLREVEIWEKRVLELTKSVETGKFNEKQDNEGGRIKRQKTQHFNGFVEPGFDRNGIKVQSYNESLPCFLKAAREGRLDFLKQIVSDYRLRTSTGNRVEDNISTLLETRDRNGSTADHWAAGNGHLACLKYLMEERKKAPEKVAIKNGRRDGKTSLHYAARNGHNDIIDYLLTSTSSSYSDKDVDVPSGDGTTPLHLACYGGHLHTIQHLIERYRANVQKINVWGCGIGHWIGMSINSDPVESCSILEYLKNNLSISTFDIFGRVQKHGHSSVHKAAQKLNKKLIQWLIGEAKATWTKEERKLAGRADTGGNRPSDIWSSMSSDENDDFIKWMKLECNW